MDEILDKVEEKLMIKMSVPVQETTCTVPQSQEDIFDRYDSFFFLKKINFKKSATSMHSWKFSWLVYFILQWWGWRLSWDGT